MRERAHAPGGEPFDRSRGRRRRADGASHLATLALLLLTLSLVSACTFERRAEAGGEEEAPGSQESGLLVGLESDAATESRVRAVLEQFREAVTVGDLSLALALLHPDATLVDAVAGSAAEAASRGEFLLELRSRHMSGMHFEPIDTTVVLRGEGTAVLFTLLAMLEEGEEGIGEETGRIFESAVLVNEGEGWRIRHLHRSVAPEP